MDNFQRYALLEDNLIKAIDQKIENTSNILGLDWINKQPQDRANQIAQLIGIPHNIDANPGGNVKWDFVDPYFRQTYSKNSFIKEDSKSTLVYSKLIIKDEQIPHLVPVPHTDWFYAYMYLDVPDDKLQDVRNLTESLSYDTMTKEVSARCHFMPANLTTLYLAKQIAQGHKSLAHAMQEYVILIPILAKEEEEGKGIYSGDNMGPWHMTLTKYTFGLT